MTTMNLRFRVHFSEGTTLGPGKIDLLEGIERSGSLSQAARDMSMSYRRAWMLLESMNTSYQEPVAITAKGGRGGGGARLTSFGHELIRIYRRFDAQLQVRALRAFEPVRARVRALPARRAPRER